MSSLAGVKTLKSDLSDTPFYLFPLAQGKRILLPLRFGNSSLHVSGSGRIPLRKDRYVIVFERYDDTSATVQYSKSEQPGRIGNSRRSMPEFSARVHLIDLIVDQRFAGSVEQVQAREAKSSPSPTQVVPNGVGCTQS